MYSFHSNSKKHFRPFNHLTTNIVHYMKNIFLQTDTRISRISGFVSHVVTQTSHTVGALFVVFHTETTITLEK